MKGKEEIIYGFVWAIIVVVIGVGLFVWSAHTPPVSPPSESGFSENAGAGEGGGGGGGNTDDIGSPADDPIPEDPALEYEAPPAGADLDCADVGHMVYVGNNDPHGLDGDGDGYGCESYQ